MATNTVKRDDERETSRRYVLTDGHDAGRHAWMTDEEFAQAQETAEHATDGAWYWSLDPLAEDIDTGHESCDARLAAAGEQIVTLESTLDAVSCERQALLSEVRKLRRDLRCLRLRERRARRQALPKARTRSS